MAGAAGAFGALSAALSVAKTRDSLARQFDGVVLFDLGAAGKWTLDLRVAAGDKAGVTKGAPADGGPSPDLTVSMSEDVFLALANGDVEPASALMEGAWVTRDAARARARQLERQAPVDRR